MRQMTPEQVAQVVELAAGVSVLLQGGLKSEVERYTTLKADVDAKLKAVGGLEKAEKVKAEADAYALDVRADADERADAAKRAEKGVKDAQDALQAAQTRLDEARGQLATAQAKQAADAARWSAGVVEQEAKLMLKEAQLKAHAEALERDRAHLAERETKFAAKLESLKAPV